MKKFFSIALALSAAAVMLTLGSCSTPKASMTYFENIATTDSGQLGNVDYELKIAPDDKLDIRVTSTNPNAAQIFNIPSSYSTVMDPNTGTMVQTPAGNNIDYLVSQSGDINFPILGKIHVAGMTTTQLADYIYGHVKDQIEDPIVTVQLTNFHVSILGEVNRPGNVSANSERFTIMDAIARAGDLTPYAVRDNILLIREENGKKEYHHLNLNDSKVFTSPYFYLKQNDMVVVQPNDVRRSNVNYNVNNGYRLQVTSAIISACSVVASLAIALFVK